MCAHLCLSLAIRVHVNTRGVYWAEETPSVRLKAILENYLIILCSHILI